MSSILDDSQVFLVVEVIFGSAVIYIVPSLLLQSFMMGVLCACVPLASYMLWVKAHPFPRLPLVTILGVTLVAMIAQWSITLQELESMLTGSSFKPILGVEGSISDAVPASLLFYASAWVFFLPLVAETVLFGFVSILFLLTAYTCFWPNRSHWRSCLSLIIPIMASLMYGFSLIHWIVSVRRFTLSTDFAKIADGASAKSIDAYAITRLRLDATLLALLSLNAVASDSIVLWRMCVVWDRARPVIMLGALLSVTTLVLNITNLVSISRTDPLAIFVSSVVGNDNHTESISVYDGSFVGIAAAFVSLGSNVCATLLVGIKVWLHRGRVCKVFRTDTPPRTFVARVMELLVESGVIYSSIWLLYCVSLFRSFGPDYGSRALPDDFLPHGAVDYLDAAMAQITSMYPLMVFILIALDKIHHSRGPRTLRNDDRSKDRSHAVTVTFELDVERTGAVQSPSSAHQMIPLQRTSTDPSVQDETKHQESLHSEPAATL